MLNPYVNMPWMPFLSSLLLGIALIALAILAGVGNEYCRLYVNQMFKKYVRWHKDIFGKGPASPPLPLNPQITPKKRRTMRTLVLISLLVFIIALVAAMISMIATSGSFEPWHTWYWFQ